MTIERMIKAGAPSSEIQRLNVRRLGVSFSRDVENLGIAETARLWKIRTRPVPLGEGWCLEGSRMHADRALECARGTYQEAVLSGREAVSGSTLKGRAKQYKSRYRSGLDAMFRRMTEAGVDWHIQVVGRRHILALGVPS